MPNTIIFIPHAKRVIIGAPFTFIADQYLPVKQVALIMQSLSGSMLGLTGEDANNVIRLAWPTGGAPAWQVNEDRAFIKATQEAEWYDELREDEYTDAGDGINLIQSTHYTRVLRVDWIFYGPNSSINADSIRDKLYWQQYHDILAQYEIYMMTNVPTPIRAPELFSHHWWERVDLHVIFYENTIRNTLVPWVNAIPVIISDNSGIIRDAETTPTTIIHQ